MNKLLLIVVVLLIFLGCTKVDENGFYLEGKYKNLHKITKKKYDEEGYDIESFNKKRFNRQFLNKFTNTEYDKIGYDHLGYDKNGFDKNGFDKNGFDKNGSNIRGFNHQGIHNVTQTKYDQNFKDNNGNKLTTNFIVGNYVDKWGEKSGEKYIEQSDIKGYYSDDRTNRNTAYLNIIINKNGITIEPSKSEYSLARTKTRPTLYVKTDLEQKFEYQMTGDTFMWQKEGTAEVHESKDLLKVLTNCKHVRMRIDIEDGTIYIFEFDITGLKELVSVIGLELKY